MSLGNILDDALAMEDAMRFMLIFAAVSIPLASCAHKEEPISSGSYDVVTSYSKRLPGKYLLYIDATTLNTTIRPRSVECAAHSFPIEGENGFSGSIRATLANVVETVEVVGEPIPADRLSARGARGLIVVRSENADGRIKIEPNFWGAAITSEIHIVATVTVDGAGGRLFGTTVEGIGRGDAPVGIMCSGGGISLQESTEKAIKDVVRKIGEGVANSDRVRGGKAS